MTARLDYERAVIKLSFPNNFLQTLPILLKVKSLQFTGELIFESSNIARAHGQSSTRDENT